jgi:iron complex transport system substrate-binding protein
MRGDDARVTLRPAAALLLFAVPFGACGRAPSAPAARQPAQRIVAASVFAAEVLLELVPRDRIVGVHFLAADARYSPVADRVAGLPLLGAEPEELLAVAPDLVVVDPYTKPETLALLEAAGVALLRPDEARSFEDIWSNVHRLGEVCGEPAAADRLVRQGQDRLTAVAAKAADRGGWRLLSLDGGLHTLGKGSLFDAVTTAVGAHNAARDDGVGPFRKLDVETVLALNPSALVLSGDPARGPEAYAWLGQHVGLRLLDAVCTDRILLVPGPLLASTSHHLVGAVEALAAQLDRRGRP